MIRHVLTWTFDVAATPAARRTVLDGLADLPGRYPAMCNWSLGRNRSRRDDTYEYAMVVDFPDEAALVAYLDSDHHERFVADVWRPAVERRAITSFEWLEPGR